ncbi:MAG: hypothetical protein ACK5L6_00375 [Anaerorhabdus sp.]|uniref:hypothetical protein n=1 Tax=Anaerorhabdus sp. TaxID=1872524 RepID=UPI003A857EED
MSLNETNQIVEKLFPFVEKFVKDELKQTLLLDDVTDIAPCISFVTDDSRKINFNVVGGYDGEFNFTIYYKVKNKDTKERLQATKTLNYIGVFFDKATQKGLLPNLSDEDTPVSLEMVTNPTLNTREENGNIVYSAGYTFIYRHANKF